MVSMQQPQSQLLKPFGNKHHENTNKSARNSVALKKFGLPSVNKSSKCVPINFPSCVTEKSKNENNRIFNLNSQSTQTDQL